MTILSSNQDNSTILNKQQIPLIRKKLVKNAELENLYIESITAFCKDYKYNFEHLPKEKRIIISYPQNINSEKVSNEFHIYFTKYLPKWQDKFLQGDDIRKYHIAPQYKVEPDNIKNKLTIYWD